MILAPYPMDSFPVKNCPDYCYNQGSVDTVGDFRQGYYNEDEDKYYGEYIWEYLQLSKTV